MMAGHRCLEVPGLSQEVGTQLGIWDCTGGANQQFRYMPATGQLKVYGDNTCVSVAGNGDNADAVVIDTCRGDTSQHWNYDARSGAMISTSGRCLDVVNIDPNNGARLQLWDCLDGLNQQWFATPIATGASVELTTAMDGQRCLDVVGISREPGAQTQLWDCLAGTNQQFRFVPSTGEIKVYDDNICLDDAGGQGNDGDRIAIYGCHGGLPQKWSYNPFTGALVGISGRCVDVVNFDPSAGARVQLWDCTGGINQTWTLQPPRATPTDCAPSTILTGFTPRRELYMRPDGDDAASGTSWDHAKRTLGAINAVLQPGDKVNIGPGTYATCGDPAGVITARATAGAPIWLVSSGGRGAAVFDCSNQGGGIEFRRAAYAALDGVVVQNVNAHGIHIDSDPTPWPDLSQLSDHILIIRTRVDHVQWGNLKVQQSSNIDVIDSDMNYANEGAHGQEIIDYVGVVGGNIIGNRLAYNSGYEYAIQIKGGSSDVLVDGNFIHNVRQAIILGGYSGKLQDIDPYYPPGVDHEAYRLKAVNNVIWNVVTGMIFRGCLDCAMINNTQAVASSDKHLRSLSSTNDVGEAGTTSYNENARMINNVFWWDDQSGDYKINADYAHTIAQSNNLWRDGRGYSDVPIDTSTSLFQEPLLVDPSNGDLHVQPGSPALGTGTNSVANEVIRDATGRCRVPGGAWNIGAY